MEKKRRSRTGKGSEIPLLETGKGRAYKGARVDQQAIRGGGTEAPLLSIQSLLASHTKEATKA
jgi:hypothetical protein